MTSLTPYLKELRNSMTKQTEKISEPTADELRASMFAINGFSKCDFRCPARAVIKFMKMDKQLTLCGHHSRMLYIDLSLKNWETLDTKFLEYFYEEKK